jgi:hypothetical protein
MLNFSIGFSWSSATMTPWASFASARSITHFEPNLIVEVAARYKSHLGWVYRDQGYVRELNFECFCHDFVVRVKL